MNKLQQNSGTSNYEQLEQVIAAANALIDDEQTFVPAVNDALERQFVAVCERMDVFDARVASMAGQVTL